MVSDQVVRKLEGHLFLAEIEALRRATLALLGALDDLERTQMRLRGAAPPVGAAQLERLVGVMHDAMDAAEQIRRELEGECAALPLASDAGSARRPR